MLDTQRDFPAEESVELSLCRVERFRDQAVLLDGGGTRSMVKRPCVPVLVYASVDFLRV